MGRLGRWVVVLGACAALAWSSGARAAEVVVDEGFTERRLGTDLLVGHDMTGALTSREVLAGALPWTPSTSSVPSYGFTTGALWARVTLVDARVPPRPLALSTPYAPLDRVTVCDDVGDGLVCTEAGDHVPRASWPVASLHGVFPLAAARRHELLVRVTDASLQLPLDLRTAELEHEAHVRDIAVAAGYYALALGLIAYNVLLWLGVGARIYGAYVAYATLVTATLAATDGSAYAALWRDSSELNDRLGALLPAAGSAALVMFFRALVIDPAVAPITHRRLGTLARIIAGSMVACALPWPIPAMVIAVAVVAATGAALVAGVPRALRGERAARLFMAAFIPILASATHAALNIAGLLPSPIEITTELKLASALELVLFAYALADRITRLEGAVLAAAHSAQEEAERARALQETARAEAETRAEEARRMDAAKTEFLTNVAHELRTPVHGVLGLTEALAHAIDRQSPARATATALRKTAEQLQDVVESIRDFVDESEGTPSFGPTSSVCLEEVAAREIDRLRDLVAEGVALRVDFPHDVPPVLASDAAVARVVRELVGNAIKFTRAGSIDIRAARIDDHVVLEVADTGAGIPDDRLTSIFEPFAQVDGSITRSVGGLGLGLTLVKRATDAYGATLAVESTRGVGTTVTVTWPEAPEASALERGARKPSRRSLHLAVRGDADLPPVTHSPSAAVERSAASPHPPARDAGRALRVLVVDDDATNRMVLRAYLGEVEAVVVEAADGVAALDLFERDTAFDVVLLDVMMPRVSGFEVCRTLRDRHDAATLPIVLLTAKSLPNDIVQGFAHGASDYVTKPFGKEELLARVRVNGDAARISRTMNRFVPRGAIDLLGCTQIADLRLGTTRSVEVAVLFADVHGFTAMSERLDASEVFATLNRLYGSIAPIVRTHGGFIDKYIGDSVMAIFPAGGASAAHAALAMQDAVDDDPLLEGVRIGIGIHAGRVLLGTLGEPERFEATVVSDVVNVASRLEGASKQLGVSILASAEVLAHVPAEALPTRALGPIRLKGRADAIETFELLRPERHAGDFARFQQRAELRRALTDFANGEHARAAVLFAAIVDANAEDAPALFYLLDCQHRMDAATGTGPLRLDAK